jgi:transcriptional regulator with XRE-family HTH domain
VAARTVASVGTKEYDELLRLLRETREAAHVSQETLSQRLGRARTYISKIEAGTRRVDVIELFAIAAELEKHPVALVQELHDRLKRLKR